MLASAQSEYGVGIQRITGEMDAADSLDCKDAAVCKELLRAAERIVTADRQRRGAWRLFLEDSI